MDGMPQKLNKAYMKLTLIRTGGIIPIIKKANAEVDWSENEIDELINSFTEDDKSATMRDSTQYQLKFNDQTFSIDLEKVPLKYKKVFEQLKDNLKIVKQG